MCVRDGSRLPEAAAISLINNSNFWRNKMSGEQGKGDGDDGSRCVYACPHHVNAHALN